MWLDVSYDLLKSWKAVAITSLVAVFGYNASVYFHPENLDWIGSGDFTFANSIKFILIDQVLIECITVAIVFQLLRMYARVLKLNQVKLNLRQLVLYELKFIPVLLVAFFVFAPFTLTVRFLFHYFPSLDWNAYFEGYFYSTELYVIYLMPVFLFGFGILNANLIMLYNQQLGATKNDLHRAAKPKLKDRIWATDEWGELFLEIEKIWWIQREERKTWAQTKDENYRLKGNITELEDKLDPDRFVRINRRVIVNLDFVLNYSFWENDKYVLRMKEGDQEFVMSRDRLHKIKGKFLEAS